MLKLFMVGSTWGVPFASAAPFPLKLEAWLRMNGLAYEAVIENDVRKGPKGKTPWIEDGALRMGDSELIISHLRQKHALDPDARLSATDRALAVAWHRTFEEHYHQAFEHQLFLGRGGAERIASFARTMPPIIRTIAPPIFLSGLRKQLHARGLGRHDEPEIIAMGKADLDAASAFLADKPYFLGHEPATVDACAFGFLATSVYVSGDNPLFAHAASLRNLVDYCERMRARYFPETLDRKQEIRR
jgi:glutathione S-transferase